MYNVRVGDRIVNLEQVTKIVQLRPQSGIDIHLSDGGLVAIGDPKEAARFIAKVPIHQDADEDAA